MKELRNIEIKKIRVLFRIKKKFEMLHHLTTAQEYGISSKNFNCYAQEIGTHTCESVCVCVYNFGCLTDVCIFLFSSNYRELALMVVINLDWEQHKVFKL